MERWDEGEMEEKGAGQEGKGMERVGRETEQGGGERGMRFWQEDREIE